MLFLEQFKIFLESLPIQKDSKEIQIIQNLNQLFGYFNFPRIKKIPFSFSFLILLRNTIFLKQMKISQIFQIISSKFLRIFQHISTHYCHLSSSLPPPHNRKKIPKNLSSLSRIIKSTSNSGPGHNG